MHGFVFLRLLRRLLMLGGLALYLGLKGGKRLGIKLRLISNAEGRQQARLRSMRYSGIVILWRCVSYRRNVSVACLRSLCTFLSSLALRLQLLLRALDCVRDDAWRPLL